MTDKHIPVSKLLALITTEPATNEWGDTVQGCYDEKVDVLALRALIDAEPESNLIADMQATIDRLNEQRDRLLDALKDLESATRHFHPCQATMEKCTALIAEIEAKNGDI